MSISLDQFMRFVREHANEFESYWIEMNEKHPDQFPLELPEDNDGLWWEMFAEFESEAKLHE